MILNKSKIIISIIIIFIGVAGRFILVSYAGIPNLEIITALTLIAGIYLGGIYSVAIPLSIIFLSDMVIGNNYIFIFTWTAFALIGLLGYFYGKLRFTVYGLRFTKSNSAKCLLETAELGVFSSIFFYLYTNFGWWLMSGMYEHSLSGLVRCYWMAIPFFRNNLLGNLIFVPVGIYVFSRVFCGVRERKVKPNCKIAVKN